MAGVGDGNKSQRMLVLAHIVVGYSDNNLLPLESEHNLRDILQHAILYLNVIHNFEYGAATLA